MKEKENYIKCIFCRGKLIWGSSAMCKDYYDGYSDSDEAVINYYKCSCCGRDYEVVDPSEEEKQQRYSEYWYG